MKKALCYKASDPIIPLLQIFFRRLKVIKYSYNDSYGIPSESLVELTCYMLLTYLAMANLIIMPTKPPKNYS